MVLMEKRPREGEESFFPVPNTSVRWFTVNFALDRLKQMPL